MHDSGSLVGLLEDGSGGANEYQRDRDFINGLFGYLTALPIPSGLGVWAKLEQTKLTLLSHATEVIATGNTDGGWESTPADMLCEAASAVGLFNRVPGLTSLMNAADAVQTAADLARVINPDLPSLPSSGIRCLP